MSTAIANSDLPRRHGPRLLWLSVFLLAYFVIGVARMGKTEFYPVGSWAMFSTVPNEITTYRLRVTAIGPKPIVPPAYYGKAEGVLTAPVKISSVATIRRFGAALKRHDAHMAEQMRGLVEHTLLPPSTSYEIVEQRYWPIERWLHKRYRESVVANFRTGPGGESP